MGRLRWSAVLVVATAVAASPLVAAPVALGGHSYHVTAQAQVFDDAVVVESFFMRDEGFLVIHTDADGSPGRIIGHGPAPLGGHEVVEVSVPRPRLDDDGTVTLWAVLHRDADRDGEFDPDQDPPIEAFGSLAGTNFEARPGSGQVVVAAPGLDGQESAGTVRVRRVSLADPGHLVLHDVENGSRGRAVGSARLPAGSHENVTVELDESYFANRSGQFDLLAVAYADDGDGEFDAATDRPVRVGSEPVSSRLSIRRVDASGSATNETGASEGTDSVVVTATRTTTGSDAGSGDPIPTPGFGLLAALAVVAATILTVRRRR